MSYRLLLKHRAFFRALNRELKVAQVGCLAVKVQVVTEEPPLLQIDTLGLSKLPIQQWWSEYLNTGKLPVPLAQHLSLESLLSLTPNPLPRDAEDHRWLESLNSKKPGGDGQLDHEQPFAQNKDRRSPK